MREDLTPWNLQATFTVSYNTVSDSKIFLKYIFTIDFEMIIIYNFLRLHLKKKTFTLF